MQEASGADFTDLNRSAHLPSSIDPAMVQRRHTFPRSSLTTANPLYVCRVLPEGDPAMPGIAVACLCYLVTCAFVIRGFKTK